MINRLEFNNKLSVLRLSDDDFAAELKDRIADLYAKILRYLVESVVYLQQHKIAIIAKDAIKRYNWVSLLQDVKDAEKLVESDDAIVKGERNTANLQDLATIARTAEDNECLRQLLVTDPRNDKKRIEEEKGGLLEDVYTWVLDNDEYKSWLNSLPGTPNVLWIRGDPGKGKTMLLCGIINELTGRQLACFFCQATDPRINSAENVLRGLLYMMADEDATSKVLLLLRDRFDRAGGKLFKDANTWVVLRDIFKNVLSDFGKELWLVIDALDECSDRQRLLDLIKTSPKNVKWLISSRNWPEIEETLGDSSVIRPLSLELNTESVSLAVQTFIDIKTNKLASKKQLSTETIDSVRQYLSEHAQETFLWVAVVVQSLQEKSNKWNIIDLLKKFPAGLEAMYTRIAALVEEAEEVELLREVISIAATVFRPLSLPEMVNLLNGTVYDQDHLVYVIKQSGFLTVQSSRVTFVHLSAKEFLLTCKMVACVSETHRLLYTRCIEVLCKTLRRNICDMTRVDCHIDDLQRNGSDLLASIAYPCVYWSQHLITMITFDELRGEDEILLEYFIKSKYIYWIEALIWLRVFSHGVSELISLKVLLLRNIAPRDAIPGARNTRALIREALCFIMFCSYIAELPLQVYTSALFFSPTSSLIRTLFNFEMPSWLTSEQPPMSSWSIRSMTYDLPRKIYQHYSIYHGGEKLAIVTDDCIQVRSARTGTLELQIDGSLFGAAAFSKDDQHLLTVEHGSGKVIIYDYSTGFCIKEIVMDVSVGVSIFPSRMAYGATSRFVVHSCGKRLNSHDCESGDLLYFLQFSEVVEELNLSHDESKLVVGTYLHIYLCVALTGDILWSIKKQNYWVTRWLGMIFTPDDNGIAFVYGKYLRIFDIETQSTHHVITAAVDITSIHIKDHHLFLELYDNSIVLADLYGGNYRTITDDWGANEASTYYYRHSRQTIVTSSLWLISLQFRQIIFYDIEEVLDRERAIYEKSSPINTFGISPDGKHLAKAYTNSTIQISRKDHEPMVLISDFQAVFLSFSYDHRLAVCGKRGKIAIWDISSNPKLLSFFEDSVPLRHTTVVLVEFSPQGQYVTYGGRLVTLHDGQARTDLDLGEYLATSAKFSGKHSLAVSMNGKFFNPSLIRIWNIENGPHLLHSIEGHELSSMSFSVNSDLFAHLVSSFTPGTLCLEVRETELWGVVDKVEMPSQNFPDLWYSSGMKQFRTFGQLIHPDPSCTELFVRGTSVYIGNEFVLRLPVEYGSARLKIHGESLIYLLFDKQIRRIEINVKRAIEDAEAMQKVIPVLP